MLFILFYLYLPFSFFIFLHFFYNSSIVFYSLCCLYLFNIFLFFITMNRGTKHCTRRKLPNSNKIKQKYV